MGRGSGDEETEARAESLELPLIVAPSPNRRYLHYEGALERVVQESIEETGAVPQWAERLGSTGDPDRWLLLMKRHVPERRNGIGWELACFPTLREAAESSVSLLCEKRAFVCVYDLASYDPVQENVRSLERAFVLYGIELPVVDWSQPSRSESYVARNGKKLYALHPKIDPQTTVALNGEKRFVGVASGLGAAGDRVMGWAGMPEAEDIRFFWTQTTTAFLGLYDLYGEDHPDRVPLKVTLQLIAGGENVRVERTLP